ncbi:hypothetical protein [Mesorhizobium retamae]|uniref:Uncharacterized protein n=1 Tax=Mesorhizobium retamae TaxID=2912854 RepID=A0ABS9QP90_9HYPH|nr:hypothetical protein [Mesorhizobium sp. IRAMC:0171]MCG7509266.1 hypothetical protein [Mesorhizobium sp. IRAMC:0171]
MLRRPPTRGPAPKPPAKPSGAKGKADEGGDAAKKRGGCAGACKKSRDDLEREANVSQQTKGKTKHGQKNGGMSEADKDFDALGPKDIKDINTQYGQGRTGTLDDGTKITVRPGSSDGRPTLEMRNPENGRGTEIRYDP